MDIQLGLLTCHWFPHLSGCPPVRLCNAGGPQPVVLALLPSESGQEAEAPAAGPILQDRSQRARQSADIHPD